jgi:UDP-glucose 4-epimerase
MRFLVTGITGRLARLLAAVLAARPGAHVLALGGSADGLSVVDSLGPMPRGHGLVDLLRAQAPSVVIHLDQPGEEVPGARGAPLHTIDLLGACVGAGVPRVVVRSSAFVYGPAPGNPAFLPESAPLWDGAPPGLLRDQIAVERFLAKQTAGPTSVITLRCAGIVGGGIESPLATYLRRSRTYTIQGFDPRIQVLHSDDAVVAIALAALGDSQGAFNIASEPLLLSQAIRLAGSQPLPLPALALSAAPLASTLTGPLRASIPFDPRFLQYACIADTRRAERELGWSPQYTGVGAIAAGG